MNSVMGSPVSVVVEEIVMPTSNTALVAIHCGHLNRRSERRNWRFSRLFRGENEAESKTSSWSSYLWVIEIPKLKKNPMDWIDTSTNRTLTYILSKKLKKKGKLSFLDCFVNRDNNEPRTTL